MNIEMISSAFCIYMYIIYRLLYFAYAKIQFSHDMQHLSIFQPTVVYVDEEDLENVFRMALILVAVLLSVLCIAICIVFYLSRQK